MKFLIHLLGILTLLAFLSGCASVVNGSRQEVVIDSQPSGAEVMINGVSRGQTPLRIDLLRKTSHLVELSLEGYLHYEVTVEPEMNAAVWGNIVAGGAIGMMIDGSNGSTNSLVPSEVNAVLIER